MTEPVEVKFEAPQPEYVAKAVRESVMNTFIDQLDEGIKNKTPLMDVLVQSGNVTVGPDNRVKEISEYLRNMLHDSVDQVTSQIGFCMVRNAHMCNITPEGFMEPVEVKDILKNSSEGKVKFVAITTTLTVRPATEEETALAERHNSVLS
jgi:hypothetical protein